MVSNIIRNPKIPHDMNEPSLYMRGRFDEETISHVITAFILFEDGESVCDIVELLLREGVRCRFYQEPSRNIEIIEADDKTWRMTR